MEGDNGMGMAMYGGMEQQQQQQLQQEAQPADRVFPPDETPPSHTLYVSNLYEKVHEVELKHDLNDIFAQFGKVLSRNSTAHALRLFELLQ